MRFHKLFTEYTRFRFIFIEICVCTSVTAISLISFSQKYSEFVYYAAQN